MLFQNINRMKDKVKNPEEFADENISFHINIAKASKNPVLVVIYNSIYDLFKEEECILAEALDLKEQSIASHGRILNSIKEHDTRKAIKEMDKHLASIQKSIPKVDGSK